MKDDFVTTPYAKLPMRRSLLGKEFYERPTPQVFNDLMSLLVQGPFDHKRNFRFSANIEPQILHTFLFSIPYLQPNAQTAVLNAFLSSLQRCTSNRAICCEGGAVEMTIHVLFWDQSNKKLTAKAFDLMMAAIAILGSHSLKPRELKGLLRLMRADSGMLRTDTARHVLQTTQQMVSSSGPASYFSFDNPAAGLSVSRFVFPVTGYSFSTWIRLEKIRENSSHRLFAFIDSSNNGVELRFEGRHLALLVYSGKTTYTAKFNFPFVLQRWHFLTITHSKPVLFFAKSQVQLYVNGKVVNEAAVKYPSMNRDPVKHGEIGSSIPIHHHDSKLSPMFMQMGSMAIFEAPLTAKEVLAIYESGPTFQFIFDKASTDGGWKVDQSTSKKLVLVLNPRSTTASGFCIDNSPVKNALPSEAKLATGTSVVCTSRLHDTLHCIGGVQIFFALLKMIPPSMVDPEYALSAKILALIRDIIATDATAQEDMVNNNGFLLLSEFLIQISDTQLNLEASSVLKSLVSKLPQNDQIQKQVLSNLILNFRVWNKTSFEMQADIISFISDELLQPRCQFRHLVRIGTMLDALYLYYPYTTPENPDLSISSTLPFEQRVKIRGKILGLIKEIAHSGKANENEISSIVGYALDTSDKREKRELLELILNLAYDEDSHHSKYLLDFETIQGLVSCLETEKEDDIRLYALKLLALFLRSKPEYNNRLETEALFLAVPHMCKKHQDLDSTLYNALMQPCMGVVSKGLREVIKIRRSQWIECQYAVSAIFQMLPSADVHVRETVLFDFFSLLDGSSENRKLFLELPEWPQLLLRVPKNVVSSSEEQNVFSIAMKCVSLLLEDLIPEKDGWKAIKQVITAIEVLKREFIPRYKYILFSQLLKVVKKLLLQPNYKKDLPLWKNIHYLCSQTEGYARLCFFRHGEHNIEDNPDHREVLLDQLMDTFQMLINAAMVDRSAMEILHYESYLPRRKSSLLRSFIDMALSEKSPFHSLFHIFFRIGLHLLANTKSGRVLERITKQLKTLLCMDGDFGNLPVWKTEYNEDDTQRLIFVLCHIFIVLGDSHNAHLVEILKGLIRKNLEFLHTAFSDSGARAVFHVPEGEDWEQSKEYLTANASTEQFMEVYLGKPWESVFASEPVLSGIKSARQEDNKLNEFLDKESSKMITNAQATMHKYQEQEEQLRARSWTDMFQKRQDFEFHEATRRNRVSSGIRTERIAAEAAQKRLEEHVQDNHIWDSGSKIEFWALDRRENSLRMRKRLCADPQGTDHSEAAVHGVRYKARKAAKQESMRQEAEAFDDDEEWEKIDSPQSPVLSLDEDEGSLLSLKVVPSHHETELSNTSDEDFELDEEEDLLNNPEDEEWEQIGDTGIDKLNLDKEEKVILTKDCSMITPLTTISGRMELTTASIYFITNKSNLGKDKTLGHFPQEQKWRLDQIEKIFRRRYLLRSTAMEVFFIDGTTYMFNFEKGAVRQVIMKILAQRLPKLVHSGLASPALQLRKSRLTQKWQRREISNFEYLMALNTFANRTYNDLTQYPVFPWVIQDYDSEKLDLNNPKVFRDLSKPIGALNEERLNFFIQRFESFADPIIPPFHYGSHYSSVGSVLFFLMRLEPFTSYFVEIQSGQFDLPDRLFHSMKEMWENNMRSHSDVKEAIPEFYYLPEFLENQRNLDLGRRQDGTIVDDIVLPPWAKDAYDFVRINREALESEYVSKHLHEWIDLIFGFKQRGPEAVNAHNVFFYLTYEGAVDIDSIDDPVQRQSVITQIANFGQTPTQLFDLPHPPRNSPISFTKPSYWPEHSALRKPFFNQAVLPSVSVSYVFSHGDRVTTVGYNREITMYKWPQYRILQPSKLLGLPLATDISTKQARQLFVATPHCRALISGGHFDGSIKVHLMDKMKCTQTLLRHKDVVTCLHISEDGTLLASGSVDTLVLVWPFESSNVIADQPKHILYGHEHAITCVAINKDLDTVVSASKDGTMLIHSAFHGNLIRKLDYPGQHPVDTLALSPDGHIAVHSLGDLWVFNINGKLLSRQNAYDFVSDMVITNDSRHIITGGDAKQLVVRNLDNLSQAFVYDKLQSKIRSLTLSADGCCIIVGLESGNIVHLPFHPSLWTVR